MKTPLLALVTCITLLCPAISTLQSAPAARPALPFGDMRFVSPAQIDEKPVPAFMPPPFALKEEFARRKLSGEAVIGFTISPKGKPEQIKVVQATNQEMAQLATAYVAKLVFRPAKVGRTAVACEAEMPFFNK